MRVRKAWPKKHPSLKTFGRSRETRSPGSTSKGDHLARPGPGAQCQTGQQNVFLLDLTRLVPFGVRLKPPNFVGYPQQTTMGVQWQIVTVNGQTFAELVLQMLSKEDWLGVKRVEVYSAAQSGTNRPPIV